MPRQRSQALKGLCEKVLRGELRFDGSMSTEAVRDELLEISGIGPWTAGYIAMRALSDPDAMPAADLVLMRAAGVAKAAELEARAEAWRPWRAYAVMYLWKKAGLAA
jgi:AraC family transcriptional regulator of adaptative response / DNA-3-methyladenine glycosylase II